MSSAESDTEDSYVNISESEVQGIEQPEEPCHLGEAEPCGDEHFGEVEPCGGGDEHLGEVEPCVGRDEHLGEAEPCGGRDEHLGEAELCGGGDEHLREAEPCGGGDEHLGEAEPCRDEHLGEVEPCGGGGEAEPCGGGDEHLGEAEPCSGGDEHLGESEPCGGGDEHLGKAEPCGDEHLGEAEPCGDEPLGEAEPCGDECLGEAEPCGGGDEHLGENGRVEDLNIQPQDNLDSKSKTLFSGHNRTDDGWCLAPAEKLWTVRRDGAVKLRTRHVSEQRPPLTVPQFFSQSVRRWDQRRALCVKRADKWTKITYAEYECQTRSVARSLLKLGLQRFHGVLILGCTSPEWFMAEIGSILAGGLAVGVDPSCSASFCQEVAIRSKAQVVIVQDPGQLEKILQVLDNLPQVKVIIQCKGHLEAIGKSLFTWDAFLALGTDLDDVCLNEVMESQKANQCCAVMYAAGVTEDVRGVMLSHDNITWMARAVCDHLNFGPNEVVVSYQPLNDLTVQLMDLWLPLCCGGTTYFAESNGPESLLISVLRHARPTIFLGCRTFWERVKRQWESLEVSSATSSPLSNEWIHLNLLRQARGRLLEHAQTIGQETLYRKTCVSWRDYMDRFYQLPLNFLSKLLVSNPARAALGLNHCTFCYSGTSVAPSETMEFFWKLGLKMLRLYGFNETCGAHGIGHPNDDPIPSCEQTVSGCLSRRAFSTKCLWGRNIFMGYLDMEEETQSVLDKDGWLCIRVEAIDADGSGREMADASPSH